MNVLTITCGPAYLESDHAENWKNVFQLCLNDTDLDLSDIVVLLVALTEGPANATMWPGYVNEYNQSRHGRLPYAGFILRKRVTCLRGYLVMLHPKPF